MSEFKPGDVVCLRESEQDWFEVINEKNEANLVECQPWSDSREEQELIPVHKLKLVNVSRPGLSNYETERLKEYLQRLPPHMRGWVDENKPEE